MLLFEVQMALLLVFVVE